MTHALMPTMRSDAPSVRAMNRAPRFALFLIALTAAPACQREGAAPAPLPPLPVVIPSPVGPLLSDIRSIHASRAITCAVAAGRVACWGIGEDGRLGDGFEVRRDRPVFVPGLEGIAEITFGNDATFARTERGEILVWGPNRSGEFGDESPDFHIAWTPRPIPQWGRVKQIRGGIPTCALREDGAIECAGKPRFRSMGDPTKPGSTPAKIPGLDDMIGVAAGAGFACGLRRDGAVYCWGMDTSGQLGDGGGKDKDSPVRVEHLGAAIEIATGDETACARLAADGVRCWGRPLESGEQGRRSPNWTTPVLIEGTIGATKIALGMNVGCALIRDGSVRCWGDPSYDGELGDGSRAERPTEARPVAGVSDAIDVSVGSSHSCALLRGGTARCWGSGLYGALGDGTEENRPFAVAVKDAVPITPAPDRCPAGTVFKRAPGEGNSEATAEYCEGEGGKREGLYIGRWATGQLYQSGRYVGGVRDGKWKDFFEHGEVVSEDLWDHGKPNGVWVAYSLHYLFAFATCFDHGERRWQVTSEEEAKSRPCP